ncbi:MAG: PIN domain-containing protein [Eggerthellaceae bacterium]|nr:PIN domain-containing protein [Eggerthellaceae bacterium]
MIEKLLVDTSAWIDHFKGKASVVAQAGLDSNIELVTHPMVMVELALGGLADESEAMKNLGELRELKVASFPEILRFIDGRGIRGKGIGYVDVNLLASCVLDGAALLSFDRKMNDVASEMGISVYQG